MANDGLQRAAYATAQARKSREWLDNLLVNGISNYRFDWQSLRKEFQEAAPQPPPPPKTESAPIVVRIVRALPFLGRVIPPLQRYQLRWAEARDVHAKEQTAASEQYANALANWQEAKESFARDQTAYIGAREHQYLSKDRSALTEYWARVLEKPVYLEQPPCFWKLNYGETDNRLVVEYALPPISLLPKIQEFRYRPDLNILEEIQYPPASFLLLYRDLLVKTTLIVLFKLFQSDAAGALNSVAINGTVTVIDRATGHHKSPCVVAIEVEKSIFSNINFSQIEPVACFNGMEGMISPNLVELEPVSPIS